MGVQQRDAHACHDEHRSHARSATPFGQFRQGEAFWPAATRIRKLLIPPTEGLARWWGFRSGFGRRLLTRPNRMTVSLWPRPEAPVRSAQSIRLAVVTGL